MEMYMNVAWLFKEQLSSFSTSSGIGYHSRTEMISVLLEQHNNSFRLVMRDHCHAHFTDLAAHNTLPDPEFYSNLASLFMLQLRCLR
eukprot:1158177-Pelagomonas_calceolata.AAC.4